MPAASKQDAENTKDKKNQPVIVGKENNEVMAIPSSAVVIPDKDKQLPESEPKQIYYLKSDGKTKVDPNGKVVK